MSSLQWLDDYGLPQVDSERLRNLLDKINRKNDPLDCWQRIVGQGLAAKLAFDDQSRLWDHVFSSWNSEIDGPRPMWAPSQEVIDQANLTHWMLDLGLPNYDSLHRWSVDNREAFWQKATQSLGILFKKEPTQVMGSSGGPTASKWLSGAELNIVESCFQSDEDQIAIISGSDNEPHQQQTYGELRRITNRVSNSLIAAGFVSGDPIAVIMPMTVHSVAIYLGIIQAGCVAVSIADSFAAPEIASRLRIAQAKGVFTYDVIRRGEKTFDLYDRVQASNSPRCIVLAESANSQVDLRGGDSHWDTFLVANEVFSSYISTPQTAINILFSSGTTGDPKAIPWNHTTAIKSATDAMLHHDLHKQDVVVWPTNLGWMMGPWLIFASLMNRATIGLYQGMPTSSGFGRFVQDAKVTMLGVVPTLVAAWRASGCMKSFDWSNIRTFSSTGETSNAHDMFYLSSLAGFKPIIEYCGGTEIGGGYISSTVVEPNAPATFTTPAMGLDFVILGEDGQPDDEGELFLIPPSMGLSDRLLNRDHDATYFQDVPTGPEGQVLRRHGDHFRRLPCGYYTAGGRVDDTMNLGGIKISSAEIEKTLNLLDEVRETAAVTAPLTEGGPDHLVIFAVLNEPKTDSLDLLSMMNQQIKQQLNPLFKIERVVAVDSFPRTASNKVMRREIRSQLAKSTS